MAVGNAELLKVINKINKKFGEDTIIRGEDIIDTHGRMTTGSLSFDVALGGGSLAKSQTVRLPLH